MNVYGELVSAQFENLASAPANAVEGRPYYNTTTKTLEVYKDGAWSTVTKPKSNLSAIVAPLISNDNTQGYSVGSLWINVTADLAYICVDSSTGAAVWNLLAGGIPSFLDLTDTPANYTSAADKNVKVNSSGTGIEFENLSYSEYVTASGQVIPAATETIVNFETLVHDINSNVNVGASWKYSKKGNGVVTVIGSIQAQSKAWSSTDVVYIKAFINGIDKGFCGYHRFETAITSIFSFPFEKSFYLNDSDDLTFKLFSGSGVSIQNTGGRNWITIR